MKKLLLLIAFSYLALGTRAQQLSQVTFTQAGDFVSFAFVVDGDVLIRVSDDGRIMEWGHEVKALRGEYYAPQLQPYIGRVTYYGPEADSVSRGKVKSIGTCTITYFGGYESEEKVGKIRTLGTQVFDYFSKYDNAALKGRLRFAGALAMDYYSSFENEAFRGRLKSIGNVPIIYFSSFDDKVLKGKLKSIGSSTYTYYNSLDRQELRGALKSGNYRQVIGGVMYILR